MWASRLQQTLRCDCTYNLLLRLLEEPALLLRRVQRQSAR
jgi:hypothetical protein